MTSRVSHEKTSTRSLCVEDKEALYETVESKRYPERPGTDSKGKSAIYPEKHTALCKHDAPCEVSITVDVEKLDRRRSIAEFNRRDR